MQEKLKLSVILPAFNSSSYIEETLQSVLNQTCPAYEIIVINDGSSDNTPELVKKFPVKLINQVNQGASIARNRGIQESTGDWVAFLDADDLWPKNKIELIKKWIFENPKTDMISSAFFTGNTSKGWSEVKPRKLYDVDGSFFKQLYRRNFIATSSVVIKKDLLCKVGGFDSSLTIAEDLDLWLRAALAGAYYQHIPEQLVFYRTHAASLTYNPFKTTSDIKKVLFRYRYSAGFKLFTIRIAALNLSNTVILIRQKLFLAALSSVFYALRDVLTSPFIYYRANQ